MPQRQNAVTVQLTVESAIKMACVRVSTLGENVEIWRGGLKKGVVLKGLSLELKQQNRGRRS